MGNPEMLHTGDGQEYEPISGVTDMGYQHSVTLDGYEISLSEASFQKLEGSTEQPPTEDK